jgi:hypothetical protein
MCKAWDGTHLFTWKLENICQGDVNSMIAQAKLLGVTGVLIKLADGSLNGDPVSQAYMNKFKQHAPAFKAAGFKVGGWIYQYLTDVQGEVDACSQAIYAGADWIVLDGEAELLGKAAQVQQFGQLFRSRYPNFPLGLSSFAISNYHPEVPFYEYAGFVDVMMPQIYWEDMKWDVAVAFNASLASYKQYGKPIAPTGQSYNQAVPSDIAKFASLVKQSGCSHLSWWEWGESNTAQLEAVKSNLILPPVTPTPKKAFDQLTAQKVIDLLGALNNASLDSGVKAAAHFAADALRDETGIPKK